MEVLSPEEIKRYAREVFHRIQSRRILISYIVSLEVPVGSEFLLKLTFAINPALLALSRARLMITILFCAVRSTSKSRETRVT